MTSSTEKILFILFILHVYSFQQANLELNGVQSSGQANALQENTQIPTEMVREEDAANDDDDDDYGLGRCRDVGSEHAAAINMFHKTFSKLSFGLNALGSKVAHPDLKTVLLLGNTGSGKSTLAQLIAGDNERLIAKEVYGDYTIVDENRIGSDTVTSKTLYPEFIRDQETGMVVCDNPGFEDTRSPNHEIIATYAMRKVVEYSHMVKIVIVVTHSSLKKGMYRDDVRKVFRHVCEFIKDIEKYKDSMYLAATKVENLMKRYKNQFVLISDEMVIAGIANFLMEAKSSFVSSKDEGSDGPFYDKAIKIIDSLLSKNERGQYTKINIFRKPLQEGKLSEDIEMQAERTTFRTTLLNASNFIKVEKSDFGYPITDNAKLYLNSLFRDMNRYVNDMGKAYAEWSQDRFYKKLNGTNILHTKVQVAKEVLENANALSTDVKNCKNPKEFATMLEKYAAPSTFCQKALDKISNLNRGLDVLDDLTAAEKYTPIVWHSHLSSYIGRVENEFRYYSLAERFYTLLSSYDVQKERLSYNTENLELLFERVKLEFNDIGLDAERRLFLKQIADASLKTEMEVSCEGNALFIRGVFILSRDVDRNRIASCDSAGVIVVAASHTFFVDTDLPADMLGARSLLISAPVWEIRGQRRFSVDGRPAEAKPARAGPGEIGQNGKDGEPAGSFVGIGMEFRNGGDLTITATGGDGQAGQDGGDGRDGENGANGTPGGNSGAGGHGGKEGLGGIVTLHQLGTTSPTTTINHRNGRRGADGEPGRVGRGGNKCVETVTKTKKRFLGIRIGTNTDIRVHCNRLSDGIISSSPIKYSSARINRNTNVPPYCPIFKRMHEYNQNKATMNPSNYDLLLNYYYSVKTNFQCDV